MMKQDVATLQATVRELHTRQFVAPSDDDMFHVEVMRTPVAELDQITRVAAVEALRRCRRFLFLQQQENQQMAADLDRLCHFKVELEEAMTAAGVTVNFIEAPIVTVPLPVDASDEWRADDESPLDHSATFSPTAGRQRKNRSLLLDDKGQLRPRNLGQLTYAELKELASGRGRRKTVKQQQVTRGPIDGPVNLLHINAQLESVLMAAEDSFADKRQAKVKPVTVLTISHAPNLPSKFDGSPTPLDAAYEACVAVMTSMAPVANEFMARLMASHPTLHPKCEAFIAAFADASGQANLALLFENIRTWMNAQHAAELAEIRQDKQERQRGIALAKQTQSLVEVKARMRALETRAAKVVNSQNTRQWLEPFYSHWKMLGQQRIRLNALVANAAREHEEVMSEINGPLSPSSVLSSQPSSYFNAPTRELTFAEKQVLQMNKNNSDRRTALQEYRKELNNAKREVDELRADLTAATKEQTRLMQQATERERNVKQLSDMVDAKNKLVESLSSEVTRLAGRLTTVETEYAEASEKALMTRRAFDALLRAQQPVTKFDVDVQATNGPKAVVMSSSIRSDGSTGAMTRSGSTMDNSLRDDKAPASKGAKDSKGKAHKGGGGKHHSKANLSSERSMSQLPAPRAAERSESSVAPFAERRPQQQKPSTLSNAVVPAATGASTEPSPPSRPRPAQQRPASRPSASVTVDEVMNDTSAGGSAFAGITVDADAAAMNHDGAQRSSPREEHSTKDGFLVLPAQSPKEGSPKERSPKSVATGVAELGEPAFHLNFTAATPLPPQTPRPEDAEASDGADGMSQSPSFAYDALRRDSTDGDMHSTVSNSDLEGHGRPSAAAAARSTAAEHDDDRRTTRPPTTTANSATKRRSVTPMCPRANAARRRRRNDGCCWPRHAQRRTRRV
jgi:hypothetical protein